MLGLMTIELRLMTGDLARLFYLNAAATTQRSR